MGVTMGINPTEHINPTPRHDHHLLEGATVVAGFRQKAVDSTLTVLGS